MLNENCKYKTHLIIIAIKQFCIDGFLFSFQFVERDALRKRYSYSELFWSSFSRIRTEYGEIQSISPYSVQMPENAAQNNSEYGHFSRSDCILNEIISLDTSKSDQECDSLTKIIIGNEELLADFLHIAFNKCL